MNTSQTREAATKKEGEASTGYNRVSPTTYGHKNAVTSDDTREGNDCNHKALPASGEVTLLKQGAVAVKRPQKLTAPKSVNSSQNQKANSKEGTSRRASISVTTR